MSLLTIVQNACGRLKLDAPSSVVANTSNVNAQTMFRLAQEEGKALARKGAWKALTSEKTFSATAAAAQTGAIPSDLDWIIPETMFNRTQRRRVDGPIDAADWQAIQASTSNVAFPLYRLRGTSLLITPNPTASDTIAYEYITKNWCQSSGGTGQAAWAADTDTAVLDEELHTLGLIWRFLASEGEPIDKELAVYESEVNKALAREGTRPRISTDGPVSRYRPLRRQDGDYRVIP